MASRRRNQRAVNIWPGFVDALATLLLVVMFALLVFTISQYVLSLALSGSEQKVEQQDQELTQLSSDLEDVSREREELEANVQGLSQKVTANIKEIRTLKKLLADAEREKIRLADKITTVTKEQQQLQASERILTEERNALISDLRVLTRERDDFAEQTDSLSSERNSLIERLTAIVGEQKKTQIELELRSKELAQNRALSAELESQLADEADRLSVLKARFANLQKENTQVSLELASEQEKLIILRGEFNQVSEEQVETVSLLAEERKLLTSLRKDFADLETLQSQTTERLNITEQERQALEVKSKELLSDVAVLQALRDKLEADLGGLAQVKAQTDELLNLTEQERVDLQERSKTLLADVAELQAIRDILIDDAEKLQTELEDMVTARNLLQARLEHLESEYAGFQENSEQQRSDLRTEVATTQEQLDKMRIKSGELEKEVRLLLAAKQSLEVTTDELKETNASLLASTDLVGSEKDEALSKIEELAILVADLQFKNAKVSGELENAFKTINADRAKMEATLAEVAILRGLREDFLRQVKTLQAALQNREGEGTSLANQLATAQASEEAQSIVLQEAQAKLDILNSQVFNLRQQITALNEALDISEVSSTDKELEIAQLSSRLNAALASKVQELARYKSEFFGRLREVVANRKDVKIVGDRFVFQSELLFESGSDRLGTRGREEMEKFAATILVLANKLPEDIDWILRVDGHTDAVPLSGTGRFRSNWDLSAARALSVVDFLILNGLQPNRLAATGFGEHQPIVPGVTPEANNQNRRIEFKLTER
ncbi:OmpA family protein [Alphaproteobacteria bacterium]|nr:OmpA family protein [Alphaproteobacteria bacterium]